MRQIRWSRGLLNEVRIRWIRSRNTACRALPASSTRCALVWPRSRRTRCCLARSSPRTSRASTKSPRSSSDGTKFQPWHPRATSSTASTCASRAVAPSLEDSLPLGYAENSMRCCSEVRARCTHGAAEPVISELEPDAMALLEASLMEANREREKRILKGTKNSLSSPTRSDDSTTILESGYLIRRRMKIRRRRRKKMIQRWKKMIQRRRTKIRRRRTKIRRRRTKNLMPPSLTEELAGRGAGVDELAWRRSWPEARRQSWPEVLR
nr:uncharacterized protein LOC127317415 isoform X2 [Lolium perenne]